MTELFSNYALALWFGSSCQQCCCDMLQLTEQESVLFVLAMSVQCTLT